MKKIITVIKITLLSTALSLNSLQICTAQDNYCKTGTASYYGSKFHGRKTASGEIFNMNALTAAHRTLPFNTYVKVTNLTNQKSVIVKINDRGPFSKNRIIDLSKSAAKKIDLIECGLAKVKVEIVKSSDEEYTISKDRSEKSISVDVHKSKFEKGKIYAISGREVRLKGFGVQIGSFSEEKKLYNEIEKLKPKTKNLYIEVSVVRAKTVFRIISGSFPDKKSAQLELKNLKASGYKGFIKKLPQDPSEIKR